MDPGLMPPTSAWCARFATKNAGLRAPFTNTAETAVISGKWVPPRNGSFRIATSPGWRSKACVACLHRERHGAQMHGHVIAHRDGFAGGVVHGAGIIAPLLDVRRVRSLAQHRAHLFGDGNQQDDETAPVRWDRFSLLCSLRYLPRNWLLSASDYCRTFRRHSCAWRRRCAGATPSRLFLRGLLGGA